MTGAIHIGLHPIQTVRGVGHAVLHPIDTAILIKDDIVEKSGTLEGQGELVGDVLIGVATGGTLKAIKETNVIGKLVTKMDQFVPVTAKEVVLGRKLDYLFGKATGSAHNIDRSTNMLRQMERIGLPDTAANRHLMSIHFQDVLHDASNIVGMGRGGTTIRESLLMGLLPPEFFAACRLAFVEHT